MLWNVRSVSLIEGTTTTHAAKVMVWDGSSTIRRSFSFSFLFQVDQPRKATSDRCGFDGANGGGGGGSEDGRLIGRRRAGELRSVTSHGQPVK